MRSQFKIILTSSLGLFFLFGCASMSDSDQKLPAQLSTNPDYKVSVEIGEIDEKTGEKLYKFYWSEAPVWNEVTKYKRKLGGSVDVQELMKRPFGWQRNTKNTPVIGLRITTALMQSWRECYMKKYLISQTTFVDADRAPDAFSSDKFVTALPVKFEDGTFEAKINCADYEKIKPASNIPYTSELK